MKEMLHWHHNINTKDDKRIQRTIIHKPIGQPWINKFKKNPGSIQLSKIEPVETENFNIFITSKEIIDLTKIKYRFQWWSLPNI